jgi:glycosyltransferase involved in cell wall biosynthesis
MKVLTTLTYYHPHWTGLTVVARRLAEGLAARGHSVTVLCSHHDTGVPARESLNGVQVVRVPTVARISRTVVMPAFPVALARLAARNDVIHLHTPMPEAPLVAVAARLVRRPTLITHHGDVVMPASALNSVIQRAMDSTIRLGMRLADRVVVHVGDYHRNSAFLAPVANKIDNIYPPVSLPPPQPHAVRAWRETLGLTDGPVVGFAGRFVEEKGFDFLLQAVPLVRSRLPNAQFVFAGDSDIAYERFFDHCRPLLDQHERSVARLGLLRDAQQMANFYAMCDVFALPSRSDCFAIVQVEALMSGTPLVTTDIPGAREVVRVTGAGRLVRPRDPAALAEGIIEVLTNHTRYRPAPEAVRAVFDPERAVDEYEDLMLRLLDARRTKRSPLRHLLFARRLAQSRPSPYPGREFPGTSHVAQRGPEASRSRLSDIRRGD